MVKDEILKIKKVIEEFLDKMGLSGDVSADEQDSDFLRFNIVSPEAGFLIGSAGDNLAALQQLVRLVVGKDQVSPVRFFIDVNGYQRMKLSSLIEQAKQLAAEVAEHQDSRWLAPMNAYERRAVHLALAELSGVKTESEGEGPQRRIVIRPTQAN
jgi:spoIIIJ-associated protein